MRELNGSCFFSEWAEGRVFLVPRQLACQPGPPWVQPSGQAILLLLLVRVFFQPNLAQTYGKAGLAHGLWSILMGSKFFWVASLFFFHKIDFHLDAVTRS